MSLINPTKDIQEVIASHTQSFRNYINLPQKPNGNSTQTQLQYGIPSINNDMQIKDLTTQQRCISQGVTNEDKPIDILITSVDMIYGSEVDDDFENDQPGQPQESGLSTVMVTNRNEINYAKTTVNYSKPCGDCSNTKCSHPPVTAGIENLAIESELEAEAVSKDENSNRFAKSSYSETLLPQQTSTMDGANSGCPWFCRNTNYRPGHELSNPKKQRRFVQKVMAVMSAEMILINIIMCFVICTPSLRKMFKDNHNYMYIIFGILVILKLISRCIPRAVNLPTCVVFIFIVLDVAAIGMICSAVSVGFHTEIVLVTSMILMCTFLFLAVTPSCVDYIMTSSQLLQSAVMTNIIFSLVALLVELLLQREKTYLHAILKVWFPSFLTSVILSLIIVFEIQEVIRGHRFSVEESDWLFTCLYL